MTAAAIIAVAIAAPASAARVGLAFTSLEHMGTSDVTGELHGARMQQAMAQSRLEGFAVAARLETWNRSAPSVAEINVNPQEGGVDQRFTNSALTTNTGGRDGVDIIILPLPDAPKPRITVSGGDLSLEAANGELREYAYVATQRETHAANLQNALQTGVSQAQVLRIEGNFSVSLWSWDFQIDDLAVPTGSHRSNAVEVPIVGQEMRSDVVDQEARLTIQEGWLELRNVGSVTVFGNDVQTTLDGDTSVSGLTGVLSDRDATEVNDGTLSLSGSSVLQAARNGDAFVTILQSEDATVDGRDVSIIPRAPGPIPGSIVASPESNRFPWMIPAFLAGIMLVAVVLHGPMRGLRFNRLQRRFNEREYIDVLSRIDPFTRRRRFRRRASFLKAVSLLSLESYKEAALYLDTLDATGPDPATRFFLKAIAAAGQGQDAVAIQHMTSCFGIDPTYKQEATSVPLLASLLPFFEVSERGSTV